jgi:hypothetical protein
MRGRAWLTGIDQHALHASVCEQAGVACEALFKVEPSRSRRLYLSTLSRIFRLKVYNTFHLTCPFFLTLQFLCKQDQVLSSRPPTDWAVRARTSALHHH